MTPRFKCHPFQEQEDAIIERGYHSTAVLLPDASIAVAGSTGGYCGQRNLTTEDFRVQVYEPPYLSCGISWRKGLIFSGGPAAISFSKLGSST